MTLKGGKFDESLDLCYAIMETHKDTKPEM